MDSQHDVALGNNKGIRLMAATMAAEIAANNQCSHALQLPLAMEILASLDVVS